MQNCDAEFYPVSGKDRKGIVTKLMVAVICTALLVLLGIRVYGWQSQQHQMEDLALVNPWNSVDTVGYSPRLRGVGNGMEMDRRCVDALKDMLADCEAAGNSPVIFSAYHSREMQQQLYESRVQQFIGAGTEAETAQELAAREVARPGESEHELGLAVDIVDGDYQSLDTAQANTATQKWLMDNSWRYGFILRYPDGSEEITGYVYEPWHYRYVGESAAEQIYLLGITLEEYLGMFYGEEAKIIFEG